MIKIVALILTLSSTAAIGSGVSSPAGSDGGTGNTFSAVVRAPEIDPASMASALTLLLGGVMVMRSRAVNR